MPHDRDEVTARHLMRQIRIGAHMSGAMTDIDIQDWQSTGAQAIAEAIRTAREEGRQEAQQRTDLMAGATGYAAGFEAGRIEGAREMRETAEKVALKVKGDNETSLEAMSMCQKRHEHRLLAPAGGIAAAERIAAAIRALPLPGEKP